MSILLLILGVVLFIGLVIIHELGHFFAARRNGVEVEEFGIGFPPKIWGKKVNPGNKGEFEFTVNLLPIGGFVRMKGENDAADAPGSFGSATLWGKTKIMLAGVFVNLIAALGLFTLLALIGMPQIIDNQFSVASDSKVIQESRVNIAADVEGDSPAGKAGLRKDDVLVSINNTQLQNRTQVGEIARQNAGKTIPFVIERSGQQQTVDVTVNQEGRVGVAANIVGIELRQSTWSAPVVAVGLTGQLTQLTFKSIGTIFSSLTAGDTKTASEQVSGPLGIAKILEAGSKIGIQFVLFIVAILSLSLAIMNILPIPALDGGRLYLLLISRALKKPLSQKAEELIVGISFLFLLGLFVLITFVDYNRFF